MVTGLLISERADARRSELLDDARTAQLARRARESAHVVQKQGPCAPARRGWLRSLFQPQSATQPQCD